MLLRRLVSGARFVVPYRSSVAGTCVFAVCWARLGPRSFLTDVNHNEANDPLFLERFVTAQDQTWAMVQRELSAGEKQSHWMWYVFPQRSGLGHSYTTQYYSIKSQEEAKAYWNHKVLRERLHACCQAILAQPSHVSARDIFGGIDTQKLHSSISLFASVAPEEPLFQQVLDRFFRGKPDTQSIF